MQYPNAQKGIGQIFMAEILALIGSVLGIILAIVSAVTVAEASDSGTVSGAGATAITMIGLFAAIIGIVAFVIKLLGSMNASKDEPAFKIALYAIIAGLVAAVLAACLTAVPVASKIFSLISNIAEIFVFVYIVQGVRNLAVKLEKPEMNKKGEFILKLLIAVYVLSLIATLLGMFLTSNAGTVVVSVISIISDVLAIVVTVLYLLYLNKAKIMLS